jgi:hypothetical protein
MAKKNLPVIRIISQNESRLHLVDRDKFVIGRSPEVEIILLSNSISRKHLSIEVRDQGLLIEDLGSSNGSFLNDMRLEVGKKYPVPLLTPIRLGNSGDVITVDLMERPMEFDQYHSLLPKFNFDLQGLLEQIVREANGRADHIMKEAQSKADHYINQAQVQAQNIIQKVRVQEDSALEIAQSKAQQMIKEAEKTAAESLEKSRQMAQSEAEALRQAAHQEAEALTAKRLEQVRVDIQNLQIEAMEKAKSDAEREYQRKSEEAEGRIREHVNSIKTKAQAEADEILHLAHKESARVKELSVQEFEKLRSEGQSRAQTLVKEAETEAEKILTLARESSERMRSSARADFDEATERHKNLKAEAEQLLQNAQKESIRLKEAGSAEAERLRIDGQKRVQELIAEAEKQSEKIMVHARESAEKLRLASRADFDEALERSKQHNQELMQNAEKEAQQLVENARKRAQFIVENQEKESTFILQELRNRIEMEARKEAQKLLREAEEEIETSKSQARQVLENGRLEQTKLDEQLALVKKELESAEQNKRHLLSQSQDLQSEITRLKDENRRQTTLNEKLDELAKQIQALELQRAQLNEKNAKVEGELEELRKKTFEELERRRQDEERKVLQMASLKAREFSARIEKIIMQEINGMLPLALNSAQIHAVSNTLMEELVSLFHFESAKHSEAISMQSQDRNVTPSFMKKPLFRIGLAASLIMGGFYLYKESEFAVQKQNKFTETVIEKQKEEARFKPVMTDEYRGTYTDNVIYKNRYAAMKLDSGIQDNWALNLNDFFLQELRLSEDNMVRFIGLETALVKKLATLRESLDSKYYEEGIARMREFEKAETDKMMQVLQTPQNFQRLRLREKVFLSQISTVELRTPAAQDPAANAADSTSDENESATDQPVAAPARAAPTGRKHR